MEIVIIFGYYKFKGAKLKKFKKFSFPRSLSLSLYIYI